MGREPRLGVGRLGATHRRVSRDGRRRRLAGRHHRLATRHRRLVRQEVGLLLGLLAQLRQLRPQLLLHHLPLAGPPLHHRQPGVAHCQLRLHLGQLRVARRVARRQPRVAVRHLRRQPRLVPHSRRRLRLLPLLHGVDALVHLHQRLRLRLHAILEADVPPLDLCRGRGGAGFGAGEARRRWEVGRTRISCSSLCSLLCLKISVASLVSLFMSDWSCATSPWVCDEQGRTAACAPCLCGLG